MLPNCIESIWIKKQKIQLLSYHQSRYEKTMSEYFGAKPVLELSKLLDPNALKYPDIKCRLIYNYYGIVDIVYQPYQRMSIDSFLLIRSDDISYPFKSMDRKSLDELLNLKTYHNEIIISRHGLVTDAFYFNLVFENENGMFTPKTPLLKGVRREYYLKMGRIVEADIREHDIDTYNTVHFINALNPLGCLSCSTRIF